MYVIRRLRDPTCSELQVVRRLLAQLTDWPLNRRAFKQQGAHIYVMWDGGRKEKPIIGMASVYFIHKMAGTQCFIEDVVVDQVYRGLGLGRLLTEHLIAVARRKMAKCVDLTSKPERKAANALYQSLGFKLMAAATEDGTNLYRLTL